MVMLMLNNRKELCALSNLTILEMNFDAVAYSVFTYIEWLILYRYVEIYNCRVIANMFLFMISDVCFVQFVHWILRNLYEIALL